MKGTNNFIYSKHLINEMVNLTIIWRLSLINLIYGRQAVEGTNNFLYKKHLLNEMANLTIILTRSLIKRI